MIRDNEQLDIKLRATLSQAVDEFNKLNKSAVNFDKSITSIVTKTDKLGNITKITGTMQSLDKQASKVQVSMNDAGEVLSKTFKQTEKSGNGLRTALSSMFNVNKLYLYWNITKRLRDAISNMVTSAIDYRETENKFNVSMGDAKPQAVKFVDQMTEAIGIAKTELMDYQSTYKNILSGLGNFTDSQSEKISESLTKMALDYSSLFNVDQADAMNKFQSALVGSIRPIRSDSGYDVSDTTIGAKAQELGIDRSVNQLNQMEKRILRIIVLMEQLRNTGAMGDLARTIEQPANQLRVLKAQIQEVGVWLGNVFMGTIGKILPYINGFLMAIKEIIKMFAVFVGYTADDSSLSDVFESVEDSTGGVSSNLGSASNKAKELRKTLMGFDVLNVINTPSNSGSSGSGGSSGLGTIDPAILGALEEYNSLMEKIRMKATEIRDKILDWLGYTDGSYENLKKIWEVIKIIGLALATYKISQAVLNFFDKLGKLDKIVDNKFKLSFGITLAISGLYAQYKGTERLLNGDIDLFSILETLGGTTAGTFGFATIIGALKAGKTIPLKNRLAIGFGITLMAQGIQVIVNGINNDDIKKQIIGVLEFSVAGFSLSRALGSGGKTGASALKANLKTSLVFTLAAIDVVLLVDIVKWWTQYYDEVKQELYNNKKDLNLGEFLNVSFNAVGEGVSNLLDSLFGENFTSGIEDYFREHQTARHILGTILNALTFGLMNNELDESPETVGGQIVDGISGGMESAVDTAFLGPLGPVAKIIKELSSKFGDWKENFTTMQTWYEEKVAPWFTVEKWEKLAEDAKESLEEKYNEFKENFKIIEDWWNEKIAPWFTKEKWEEVINNAITELQTKFNTWKEEHKPIEDWWNTSVAPWFTKEKWQELIQKGIDGIKTNFNEWKSNFKPIEDWWNEKVAPWFKVEKWKKLGSDAIGAVKKTLNLDGLKFQFPHIKWVSDGYQTTGWVAKALEVLNLPTKLPKLSVSWYAEGGLPNLGELFVAREAGPELVGKIGNTTSVMNNQQIVQAVSQGVAQAVASVMGNRSGGDIRLIVDGRELTTIVEERSARNRNIYGTA